MIGHPFVVNANADNAQADAVVAAKTGRVHYATGVHASFSATAEGLLQILDGADVIFEQVVYDDRDIPLPPLVGTDGQSMTARLAASGGAGNIGYVTLSGYTL